MKMRLLPDWASFVVLCAWAICSYAIAAPAADAEGDLLMGVRAPPNSKTLGIRAISSGGQQASYSTAAAPADVISFFEQSLPATGWVVAGSGSGSGGGGVGLKATNGPKYLSLSAGGPKGITYVRVCVWPLRPSNDRCG